MERGGERVRYVTERDRERLWRVRKKLERGGKRVR